METSEVKKVSKSVVKKVTSSAIRVSVETRKKLLTELVKINKKSLGKKVKMDALLLKLLSKLTAADVSELQEASLTGKDRMEQSYKAYCLKFGQLTMDDFLARLSEQALQQTTAASAVKT